MNWLFRYANPHNFMRLSNVVLPITAIATALCLAAGALKRPAKQFPSLTSRLRVAIKANPIAAHPTKPDRVEAVRVTVPPTAW